MIIVGIDPGLDGGIACFDTDEQLIKASPMPTLSGAKGKRNISLHGVKALLEEAKPSLVIMEQVSARPGQGVTSVFTFGYGLGLVEGIIFALGIPLRYVAPQTWQKKVLAGYPRNVDKPSTIFCQRTFPTIDWRASPRCRTPHDGMTDSACLAYYGYLEHTS